MKTRQGDVQGYNAQAVVTEDQYVVAAGVEKKIGVGPAAASRRV